MMQIIRNQTIADPQGPPQELLMKCRTQLITVYLK